MRRIRPPITERSRDDRVLRTGRHERLDVHRMSDGLFGRNEAGADSGCIRARGERRSHRTAGTDSPRGDERQLDDLAHLVEKREEPDGSTNMTTGLDALYDQDIATCVARRSCLIDGADLPTDPSPTNVGYLNQRSVRFTPEELDERTPGSRVLQRIAIEERNQEIDPERESLGYSIQMTGECPSADRPGQHSKPTGTAHRHSEIRRSNPSH